MKLSEIATASVDANSLFIGLKTVGGSSTDYKFTIADLAAYLNIAASPVKANADVMGASAAAVITSYALPASDGTYVVQGYLNLTDNAGNALELEIAYTDENSVSQTALCGLVRHVSGVVIVSVNAVDTYAMLPTTIRCKASSTITVTVNETGVGAFTADWGATISLLV